MLEGNYSAWTVWLGSPRIPAIVASAFVACFVIVGFLFDRDDLLHPGWLAASFAALFVSLHVQNFGRSVKVVAHTRAEARARRQTVWIAFGSAIAASVITILLMGVFKIY